MKKIDPLKYLERSDKWYLGGGNRLIWTPPFPVWLDFPGFWDKAHYYNYEIDPVFTWTILDEDGAEISLRAVEKTWDPAKLLSRYRISDIGYPQRTSEVKHRTTGLNITEVKCCLPNDVLTSVVRIKNTSNKKRKLHLIAWTTQLNYPSKQTAWLENISLDNNKICFTKHLHSSDRPPFPFECAFGIGTKVDSYSINLSEGSVLQPHWNLSPFYEKFSKGKLPNEHKLTGVNGDGFIHMALHAAIELKAKSEREIGIFFAAAPSRVEASANINFIVNQADPVKVSEQNWNDHFSSVPYFQCSDEYLTRYYWYRSYGMKLLSMRGDEGNYKYPAVCEGIGYFRAPISYSATCHMLENRWMHDPSLARGSLLMFIENQRNDGGFRGYIDVNYYRQEMFYHSNWGNALTQLHAIHPSREYLRDVYEGLKNYAQYFDRERDKERSGLYDINNHYETGQEYMHRYLAVNAGADKDNWGDVFRLKGVDVAVYIYELKKTLEWVAESLGKPEEQKRWREGSYQIKQSILENMWDPVEEMFFDVDPATGTRTMVKSSVCFYPYMTDIVSEVHLPGLKKHLLNRKEFWTPFPVPSSSVDDKYFSAEPEWKGKRMNCPWNGRVWPMTNSHIAEVLAQSAIRFGDRELRKRVVEFINKFIRMMFHDGDVSRPNCFEHYNPMTGKASLYRSVDDYQHSWVSDLIIKYIAGIQPQGNEIIVDQMPFDCREVLIENLIVQGHTMRVRRRNNVLQVWLDGELTVTRERGKRITVNLIDQMS